MGIATKSYWRCGNLSLLLRIKQGVISSKSYATFLPLSKSVKHMHDSAINSPPNHGFFSSKQSSRVFSPCICIFHTVLKVNMDASSRCLSSLNCEVSIIRAKNIELKSSGDLFVRCHLSAGNNTRVQLNSKEISSMSDLFWDEFFSLECLGTEDAINSLKQGNAVFELRWRSTKSLLGRIGGSKLLGRAEIPWKNVLESPNTEIETWFQMISKNSHVNPDVKPPSVQVRMKVGVPPSEITDERTQNEKMRRRLDESCGCKDGGCQSVDYVDYDFFALGFALEAL